MRYAILVNSDDGLDELSLGAPSTLLTVTPEGVTVRRLEAATELRRHHDVASIRGGDTNQNVEAIRAFLKGTPGAIFDVVCANAALALIVADRATSLEEGFDLASASVREGRAGAALDGLIRISNS
jgi:anthranilate phosphoribosyltransferase